MSASGTAWVCLMWFLAGAACMWALGLLLGVCG